MRMVCFGLVLDMRTYRLEKDNLYGWRAEVDSWQ